MTKTKDEGTRDQVVPAALISSNPLQWIRFFGPGAIVASVTVGSGELIFPARGGALFGFHFLYLFWVIALLKWSFVYASGRHLILTGAHPYERWNSLPGPRGWLPLLLTIILVITIPMWYSFLVGLTGQVCTMIFGIGDQYIWGLVAVVAAVVLLVFGGYDFLERTQTAILGLMVVCIAFATAYVAPNWAQVLQGFIPQTLSYSDWALDVLPDLRQRPIWVELMVYASVVGGQSYDYMGYLGFMRDKKWGNSRNETATRAQMEKIAERKDHPARLWVRAVLIDTLASFFMIVVTSAAFGILGAMILRPAQQIPEGLNLLTYQASFLTTLHPWLLPLYYLAVFLAFFGILYGGPELTFRALHEYLRPLPWWKSRLNMAKLRKVWIGYALGGGLTLLWVSHLFPGADLVDIITPAGIYTGVLTCGFFALANPWVDRRFLPAGLRMSRSLVAANIVSGVLLVLMGLKALWDYDQVRAYVVLAALLLAAILLASRLKFFHQAPDRETGSKATAESRV